MRYYYVDVAYCWGANANGQIGDGTTISRLVPTPINTPLHPSSITAGGNHTCFVYSGNAYCFGRNAFGQLGTESLAVGAPTQMSITISTVNASATIDPSFTFSISGASAVCNGESNFASAGTASSVPFGHINTSSNVSAGQALSVASNAGSGFAVYLRGNNATGNLVSSSRSWTDATGIYASPASLSGEAFGYTYKDSTSGTSVTNPASAKFIKLDNAATNAVMGSASGGNVGTGCVTFDAQTSATTAAGSYSAVVIYTAVPAF